MVYVSTRSAEVVWVPKGTAKRVSLFGLKSGGHTCPPMSGQEIDGGALHVGGVEMVAPGIARAVRTNHLSRSNPKYDRHVPRQPRKQSIRLFGEQAPLPVCARTAGRR